MNQFTLLVDFLPAYGGTMPVFEVAASSAQGLGLNSGVNATWVVKWSDGTTSGLANLAALIDPGVRYQIALTYDGTTLRTYCNGVAGTTAAAAGKKLIGTDALPILIGAGLYIAYSVTKFAGTIYEVSWLRQTLSAGEIDAWFAGSYRGKAY